MLLKLAYTPLEVLSYNFKNIDWQQGTAYLNAGSGLKSRSQKYVGGGGSHLNLANWTLDKKYQ